MVKIDGEEYGTGIAKSKKEAKAAAAKSTWDMIEPQQSSASNVHVPDPVASPPPVDVPPPCDYVSKLNDYAQKTSQLVDYSNVKRTGDAHAPIYSCSCKISGHVYGNGTGNTLDAAKQAAAEEAYKALKEQESLSLKSEDSNHRFHELSNSSRKQSPSESWGITFRDSATSLAEKVKDISLSEEPPNSRRNVPASALKSKRVLAPNFDNARNEQKKVLSNICRNRSEADDEYTVDERFRREYENIEPIGKGGFGNVFKATSRVDERTYAVKRVELIRNVKREVKELAKLGHENIVRYYYSWEGTDHMIYPDASKNSEIPVPCLFIQMELCEQGPLDNWIENNRQNQNYHMMAQDKFLQILKGVDYIHSENLIHRDLKPQNIFLSREGKIKIGDFGLVTSVTYDTLTKNRGTRSYMAPEQFGDRYGKEVDIYALGLIWFEILYRLVSHHEKNKVWQDVREGHLPLDFTKQFKIQVPIIKKMLSEDPSKRCSASQLLDILKSRDKDNSQKPYSH
ncbi:interferon-induced, double-stranded RNA-activated protein kinase isoform X2 [Coturnix japonica]|nr:interferon-induced, double-stranded RNA-activated protein kinase isoform X2 [Coturnix japonica]XP_015713052.1 interferon-induced, double-stranded RNA-activated protein kinase isoform X2 [Coturnix japonica]XP_015713053.1 interferon-induced, double-stranded RNA-activated protein kinase isoform X2 [Coturnix japonica]